MTCRYRFILMGANTVRDTPVVPLMEFNESIRVLSPLHRLSSAPRPHYHPYPERAREKQPSLRTSHIYGADVCRCCWMIVHQLFSSHILHTHLNVIFFFTFFFSFLVWFFESLFRKSATSKRVSPTHGQAKDGEGQEKRCSSG